MATKVISVNIHKTIAFIKESFNSEDKDFTTGSIRKAVILLAIPMILEMSMESIFAVVDIFFVAKLGSYATATVGLTESMLAIIYSIGFGISMATTAMVARRIGEKNYVEAANAAARSILIAISLSIVITLFGIIYAKELLYLMGATKEIAEQGFLYTAIMLGGNLVIILLFLLNGIFRGAGNAAIAMKSLWLANICNIILCPLFIHYYGLTGAAIATTIGRSIGVIYQLHQLLKGKGFIRLYSKYFKPQLQIIKNLISVTTTATLQFIITSASWIAMARIMTSFGNEAIAGYTIAIRLIVFFILPAFGLSNAAATLVGQNLGAKQPDRAAKSVWKVAKYNAIYMGFVSVLFLFGAETFVKFFAHEIKVIETAVHALRVISLGYIFYGIGMVMMNAFNGAGDTKTPTIVNFFWFWIIQIPMAYIAAKHFNWGEWGVYFAIVITETMVTITSMYLFTKGKWKLVKI
ncbi:MAG TPA: MATE family efflux transporter [Chitinophagaceae bacterium]|nr:MATE family efflux transporter [Chitinophagaceae bacterium]